MLDLTTLDPRFLHGGGGFEVLQRGKYAGHLIYMKDIPHVLPGRIFRYWLLDPDGKEIGESGPDQENVRTFKDFHSGEWSR